VTGRVPVPTGRLALAVAVGSVVVLGVDPPWGLVGVNAALLAAALVDWLLAVRPAAIGVERELPGVVQLGAEAAVVWRVRNPSGRRLHVRVSDELAPSLRATTRRVRLTLPPRARVRARA
jgi:hypothetical protein